MGRGAVGGGGEHFEFSRLNAEEDHIAGDDAETGVAETDGANVLSLHSPPRVDGADTARRHAPDDSQPDDDAVNPYRAQSERPEED